MKFFITALAGLASLSGIVSALPIAKPHPLGGAEFRESHAKRQTGPPALTDLDIMQFALTLEHLEAAFYKDGFAKFPAADFEALGLDKTTIDGLIAIGETEATHVTALMAAIAAQGGTPVSACTYNFGFTDAKSMVGTAKVLEAVGVSAYLGAAPFVTQKAVLGAAASIVTVEARHQTFIRTALKESPVPQAFDVAIGVRQVFTLAKQFIVECPAGSLLDIQAFPTLVIKNADTVTAGSVLTLDGPDLAPDRTSFCAFSSGETATQFSPVQGGSCTVPDGLKGEAYVVLTSDPASIDDDKIIAGPAVIIFS